MTTDTLLHHAAALARPQDLGSLLGAITDAAAADPGTSRAVLYRDDFGALAPTVDGEEAPVDVDVEQPTDRDGWRLLPIESDGMRLGVLALERVGPAPVEALLPHMGAALASAGNYAMLEDLVNQEMATAVAREAAIQLLLDSMSEGLLVVDLEGCATETRSKAVSEWLGPVPEGEPIWSWLAGETRGWLPASR